jgi:hypothetical protein
MRFTRFLLAATTLAASLLLPFTAGATQAAPAAAKASTKAPATPPATAADVSAAQAKGLVWVNKNTKVYHKGGAFYGKTKSGEFMTEADAQKAGYKAAQEPVSKKAAAPKADAKSAPKK